MRRPRSFSSFTGFTGEGSAQRIGGIYVLELKAVFLYKVHRLREGLRVSCIRLR